MSKREDVSLWEEDIIIPTYTINAPDKNPMFLEKRAYQGSSGKVYPLPVTDGFTDKKEDKKYRAVFLENKYLRIMLLPELGGRVQRAIDKTNNYDFVYYNNVIKPALVGLVGPWISGGIEFNWPQHHRPSTFESLDYSLKTNEDGSKTLFCGETDRLYGTRTVTSFTLYPETAYLEISGKFFNPTDVPQTFMWWANPAVHVNDHTFSVFPADVNAVMDHGKRAVSSFPIATGEYYKTDYSAGVDISRYKNIPVPTSYMAHHSEYDFMGNYDEQKEAGLLHIADHHISPGKKQWTWGNSEFGKAWDRNLTDEDGPYIELMTGVFTDNQPDFTWLKPYEEKIFTQYFMPYKKVGRVKNATRYAALSYIREGEKLKLVIYATAEYKNLTLEISVDGKLLWTCLCDISPESSAEYYPEISLSSYAGVSFSLLNSDGEVFVNYTEPEEKIEPVPEPAKSLPAPCELKNAEDLFLAGEHLEQYRHATYEPENYYLEGLRRFPDDSRLNNAYGLLLYRRGLFRKAEKYLRKAVEKETWLTANPYKGESYYNLGLSLFMQERFEEAYDIFYKATWSAETQCGGFYYLACLSCRKKDLKNALEFIEKSLVYNSHNVKSRVLKCAILRKLGQDSQAFLKESLSIDPLSEGLLNEMALSDQLHGKKMLIKERSGRNQYDLLVLATDYSRAGFFDDAIRVLEESKMDSPLIYYYLAWLYNKKNDKKKSEKYLLLADECDSSYCFPNRIEDIPVLEYSIIRKPDAGKAYYYLGNLLYDKKQYSKAAEYWESSVRIMPGFPTNYRNLSIYYYNKVHDVEKAFDYIKKAFSFSENDARILFEYDQLAECSMVPVKERLELLEDNICLTKSRDDLCVEYITLMNTAGENEKALSLLSSRRFHPWEGGEGRVGHQYAIACTELAKRELLSGKLEEAEKLLRKALVLPENLGEGKLPNAQDNIVQYYLGIVLDKAGRRQEAVCCWENASCGLAEPTEELYYNDQPSDTIFYQGLACEKLGKTDEAKKRYHKLITFGEQQSFIPAEYDYFAVSLPEITVYQTDLNRRKSINCSYLRALGYLGLNEKEKAKNEMDEILKIKPDHQGAVLHLGQRICVKNRMT